MYSRRSFIQHSMLLTGGAIAGADSFFKAEPGVMTVTGMITPSAMDYSLIHEHILVDFVGAQQYDPGKWNREEVIEKVLPYLREVKEGGYKTFVDCTPNYLGRDVVLLKEISIRTGLQIITNTGYYGGSDNKYLPADAFSKTAVELADHWTREYTEGIDGTKIKPGFIKTSVNNSELSEISEKLITAAGYCHLKTGLVIASHTGPSIPAFQQLTILQQLGVEPGAFIWVHAQNEKDWKQYVKAAKQGAWVSLDGVQESNISEYVKRLSFMKENKQLRRTLISHDAGWFDPQKPGGGPIRGYTSLFQKLIPALKEVQFTEKEILQLVKYNPAEAFTIRIRKR
ncbi:MAG: phosphotriesterase family protein [Flavitalea sp.]